jgi:hypothetical protein
LAIVAGGYSRQRPTFGAALECIEVLRRTQRTLRAGCVELSSTHDLDGREKPMSGTKEPDRVPQATPAGGITRIRR